MSVALYTRKKSLFLWNKKKNEVVALLSGGLDSQLDQIKKWQKDVFLVGLIVSNDIGTKYRENPDYNEVLMVDSKGAKSSGWKKKSDR